MVILIVVAVMSAWGLGATVRAIRGDAYRRVPTREAAGGPAGAANAR